MGWNDADEKDRIIREQSARIAELEEKVRRLRRLIVAAEERRG
ncbi:hypothetical protein [Bifidobacterium platyrrhinorum]|nr:hypothetical protein [Bifidobacterium platyrrhinorum]